MAKKSKSVLKNIRKTKARTAINKQRKLALKRALKEFKSASEKDTAISLLPKVQSIIDKAQKQGIIHKNKAARLKAKIAAAVSKLGP